MWPHLPSSHLIVGTAFKATDCSDSCKRIEAYIILLIAMRSKRAVRKLYRPDRRQAGNTCPIRQIKTIASVADKDQSAHTRNTVKIGVRNETPRLCPYCPICRGEICVFTIVLGQTNDPLKITM